MKLKKTGFPRKQESGVSGLEKPFFPISFRTDRP
ncbi:pilS cassette protein, partial [Neisseria gonorrhoeae]